MNALQSMESFIQERLQILLNKMSLFSSTLETLDLGRWCHYFAFDVIGELVSNDDSLAARGDPIAQKLSIIGV
jgi:hypothetical protein